MPRFTAAAFVVALACTLASSVVALSSCSDEAPAAPGAEDAATDGRRRAGDDGEPNEEEDAGIDVVVPPIILPTCIGTSIPMTVSGVRAFVEVPVGTLPDGGPEAKGQFVVDFGSTGSTIDLEAFGDAGRPTPFNCAGDAAAPGAHCSFDGFEFFGPWGDVALHTADHSVLFGPIRQAGIIATDFLARNPFTLDFARGAIHRSDIAKFCTDAQLLGAGLRPLPAGGFYSTDIGKLRPLSEVLSNPDASTGFVVPNVPTVPITIAGVAALAQLDTGYEDRLSRRSMNVNEALFAQLDATGRIHRNTSLDIFATTCVPGLNETLEGYSVDLGQSLEFIGEGGSIARKDEANAVYLKRTIPETFKCGGISTWTVPAGQVGASFFIDARALVIDPSTSRVWIPKN